MFPLQPLGSCVVVAPASSAAALSVTSSSRCHRRWHNIMDAYPLPKPENPS